MSGIFVNHRNADNGWAVLLDRELSRRLGASSVFRAGRSIRPGEDFHARIMGAVRQTRVMLVIIGSGWSTVANPNGERLLDDTADWVRREISYAFRLEVAVVPVLIDNTPALTEAQLPADIARLARCQYVRLRERNDQLDLDHLLAELISLNRQRTRHHGTGRATAGAPWTATPSTTPVNGPNAGTVELGSSPGQLAAGLRAGWNHVWRVWQTRSDPAAPRCRSTG
jgi:hypothetical protein